MSLFLKHEFGNKNHTSILWVESQKAGDRPSFLKQIPRITRLPERGCAS